MNVTSHWTQKQKKAFRAAWKRGDKLLYCLTDRYGRPSNGGQNNLPPAAPGVVHETEGREICSHGLHATSEPHKWAGELVWIVALGPDAETDNVGGKWCSTRREFIGMILPEEAILCGGAAAKSGSRNLNGASLDGANLNRASLYWANLNEANLYGASLYGANLNGASLDGANLDRASLYGANLDRAYAGVSPKAVTVARLLEYGWIVNRDGYVELKGETK